MHFMLRASDVSALCGRNSYRNRQQAMADLVAANVPRLNAPPVYRDVLWDIEELIRSGPVYTEALTSRELNPTLCSLAEREANRAFNSRVHHIPPNDRRTLRNMCRTMYLKDRGIVMEVDVLRRLETVGVPWIPSDRKRRFFTRTFVSPYISYTINGSIDGFEGVDEEDPEGLIEVKNRRDRFQRHEHDVDQVMVYVILSGLSHGRLVQCVGNGGALDTSFVLTNAEANERWHNDVRPILECTLVECATMIREAATIAARNWKPLYVSHVVAPTPPPHKRFHPPPPGFTSADSPASQSCTTSEETASLKSSAAPTGMTT
jgi:hypothetical protein